MRWVEAYRLWRLITVPLSYLKRRDDLERVVERSEEELAELERRRLELFQRLTSLPFVHPCRGNYFHYVSSLSHLDRIMQISNENMDDDTRIVKECVRNMVNFYRMAIFRDILDTDGYTTALFF